MGTSAENMLDTLGTGEIAMLRQTLLNTDDPLLEALWFISDNDGEEWVTTAVDVKAVVAVLKLCAEDDRLLEDVIELIKDMEYDLL
jgi:hypothetical protein